MGGYGAAMGVVIPGLGSIFSCFMGLCLIDGGVLLLAILIPIISGIIAGVIARGSASRGFIAGFSSCMIGYFINFLIFFLVLYSWMAPMYNAPYGGYGTYPGGAYYMSAGVAPLAQIAPAGAFMGDLVVALILMLLIMPILVGVFGGIGGAIMSAILASPMVASTTSSTTNIIQAPAPASAPVVVQGGPTATSAAKEEAKPAKPAAGKIKCPACGTENESGTTFCQSCGTRLKS
jgi:hypothetical protein